MVSKSKLYKLMVIVVMLALLPFIGLQPVSAEVTADSTPPNLTLWIDTNLVFGSPAVAQRYFNIPGNVSDPESGIQAISYTINTGTKIDLDIGPDRRRLQSAGDFNVDLDRNALRSGTNTIVITAWNRDLLSRSVTVTVDYRPYNRLSLPFTIDWSKVSRISDVAQIVDGRWTITPQGARNTQIGYDRLLAIGDITWRSYEVLVPFTINAIDTRAYSDSNWGSPAVGIINHWQGHTDDPVACGQPKCGWNPNGALNWYRFPENLPGRLSIITLPSSGDPSTTNIQFQAGHTYWMRASVEVGTSNVYSLKAWEAGTAEPAGWTLTKTASAGNASEGAFLLVSHFMDVTFGNISVTAPGQQPGGYTLNVSIVGSGTVTRSPNQATYSPGQVVTLTANPGAGSIFTRWSGDASGTAAQTSVTMNGNRSVTATFTTSADLGNRIFIPWLSK